MARHGKERRGLAWRGEPRQGKARQGEVPFSMERMMTILIQPWSRGRVMSAALEDTPLGRAAKAFREAEHEIEHALAGFVGGFPEYNLLRVEPDTGSMGARLVIEFDFLVDSKEIPRAEVLSNLLAPQLARLGIGTVEVRRQVVDEYEIPEVEATEATP